MYIKFWGVRGSLAMPLAPQVVRNKVQRSIESYVQSHGSDLTHISAFLNDNPLLTSSYGGHTSCVEISSSSGQRVVIDAGSGLKALGDQLVQREFGAGQGRLKLLANSSLHLHG